APARAVEVALTFISFGYAALLMLAVLVDRALRPWPRARAASLLVASIVFYAAAEPMYVSVLVLSILVDFVVGARLATAQGIAARRGWLLVSLTANLGALGFFKYGDMLLESAELLAASLGWPLSLPRVPGGLPIGISFYTFQTLTYTLDRYAGRVPPARSALDFALFVCYFPQLVAGPIVRARELLPQLEHRPEPSVGDVGAGLMRLLIGVVKKALIADPLRAAVVVGFEAGGGGPVATGIGLAASYLALYCDFSGYTDIALGSARLMGLSLPENFDRPGLSRSPMEHWRRWHMTLSSLLHEYVYAPLCGGPAAPGARRAVALFITFFVAGAWHGGAWSYALMGVYNGTLVVVWRLLRPQPSPNPLVARAEGLLALGLVSASLVFMRPVPIRESVDLLRGIVAVDRGLAGMPGLDGLGLLALAGALHLSPRGWKARLLAWAEGAPALSLGLIVVVVVALALRVTDRSAAFTYFQF
ncbi:MAG: hypothetical protein RL071_4650, partial [Pseudomonadota bacterium]